MRGGAVLLETMMVDYNLNDPVRVTLTRKGANLINTGRVSLKMPKGVDWATPGLVIEDQFWRIINQLGPHIDMGTSEPIKMTVQLVNP